MGVFDRFKKGQTNASKALNHTIQELNAFFGVTDTDLPIDKLNSASYYACMQIRCNAIAKLPLKIYKESENGIEKATNFYLYDVIKSRPNPYMSMHDLLFAAEYQKLEFGNAYILPVVVSGKVKELYLLDSPKVQMWVDDAGIIGKANAVWYIYTDKNGKEVKFRASEIVHLKNFTKNGLIGIPIKKYLAEVIENEQYSSKFLNNHYKNGLSGGATLNFTGDLDDKTVKKMRERFETMTSGLKNAGRIIPIPMGFKLEPFNVNLVESEFFSMQGLTVKHIANAFGVKSFQLNDLERSTYSNVETQNRAFYSDTLQNELTKTEQEFDYKLLKPSERQEGHFMKFNVDVILRSDFKTRMDGYAVAIQNGIYTPAECRDLEDKPFIDGSDKLVCNGNIIPLSQVGSQYSKGGGE